MNRRYPILALCLIVLCAAHTSHAADAGAFNVHILFPGMTKTIDIDQQQTLPFGCPQFFVFTIGSGFLGMSIIKDDVPGDTIFMTGLVRTGGSIVPIRRIGTSSGMIDQVVELEGDSGTIGFAWLWCGVAASQNLPAYKAQLRLSLQP